VVLGRVHKVGGGFQALSLSPLTTPLPYQEDCSGLTSYSAFYGPNVKDDVVGWSASLFVSARYANLLSSELSMSYLFSTAKLCILQSKIGEKVSGQLPYYLSVVRGFLFRLSYYKSLDLAGSLCD
jgi:hypothetical protein